MSKLSLQFEGIVLREYTVGSGVTIGRLPDNTVVIDNPAVSGHHARVITDGDRVVLEDLKSTNGTFVNGRPIATHVLHHGDTVLVGKHHLLFDRSAADQLPAPAQALQGLGDTVYLDTKQHRELRAGIDSARAEASHAGARSAAPGRTAPRRVGVLRVVAGRTELPEYALEAHTSLIGRSNTALVRLRGWFKPDVAVAITRGGDGYVATLLGGKTLVNDAPLSSRHELREGDILRVSGLTLEFRWKAGAAAESAA